MLKYRQVALQNPIKQEMIKKMVIKMTKQSWWKSLKRLNKNKANKTKKIFL